jgi:hypothetical protein
MKCPERQTENPETRKFCCECSAKLRLLCPQCGSENLLEDKFCGEFGFNLTKTTEAPSIDYSQPESYTQKFLALRTLTHALTQKENNISFRVSSVNHRWALDNFHV